MMSARLDEMEANREARHIREDAEELKEELAEGNTMPIPTQPFSDQELWPPKPRTPVPIETL